ncbi:MAG: class I adenylate-forming enzyme family protein [Desulfobacterales bacterium]|nr:class I adenylate-forming enzyme family protein [Desulfobacterales bacterium]
MAKMSRYTPGMIDQYRAQGFWNDTNLADYWDRNAKRYPHAEAIVDSRNRLTWSQAGQWIDRLALGLLEQGLRKDDIVASQLPNCIELCLLRVACEKTGIMFLPAMPNLRRNEMEYILGRCGAKAMVIPWTAGKINYFDALQKMRPRLPELEHIFVVGDRVPPGTISMDQILAQPLTGRQFPGYPDQTKCPPTEIFLLLHTTGSTGFPKLVEYPICSRVCSNKDQIKVFRLTRNDTVAILGPALAGPNNVPNFTAPEVGAKIAILDHFSPEGALQLIAEEKVTFVSAVPAQLTLMLEHPMLSDYDLSSVRYWYSVGASLPDKLGSDIEEKIGGVAIVGYGLTDWGGMTLTPPELPRKIRLASAGKPIWGSQIKVVDDDGREVARGEAGEVWGKGPCCVSGYFNDPEATRQAWTEDGWFRTGDLGRIDERGFLAIVGRKKDMIIRGGSNIYPVEIENLLLTHPRILHVAIVKMPDPVMGEKACAYVVPRPGRTITFAEMTAFLKDKEIADYKLPERLEVVDSLPMAGGGQKVDKKILEKDIEAKLL